MIFLIKKKLNRLWRQLGTGFMFALFGIGGLILSLCFFPLLNFFTKDHDHKVKRNKWLIHKTFGFFVSGMEKLGLIEVKWQNLESIDKDGGHIILANHPSLIDIVLLISKYPQATCLVKKGLYSNFFLRHVVQGGGYISNDGGYEVLDSCKKAILNNDCLIIFPEGTRTVPGQKLNMQRGAAQIALRINAPIRLVKITVRPDALTKGCPWYRVPASKPIFNLEFLGTVEPQKFLKSSNHMGLGARKLTQFLEENLEVNAH